jgi:hypothetical protein
MTTQSIGIHDLKLRLINKVPEDTVVDDQGNIQEDVHAVIEKISVDDIDLTAQIDQISRYYNFDNHPIKTNGWLTSDQDFTMFVQTPGWYFFRNIATINEEELWDWLLHESQKKLLIK